MWRVREGGEAGSSTGESQSTSSEKVLGFPSDSREGDDGTKELFDGNGGLTRW